MFQHTLTGTFEERQNGSGSSTRQLHRPASSIERKHASSPFALSLLAGRRRDSAAARRLGLGRSSFEELSAWNMANAVPLGAPAPAAIQDKPPMMRQPAPFLNKTWGLLEDPANSHLITWTAAGDAFVVVQPEAFARELLPTVFKHNNYTSFVRQLNIYGFRKLPSSQQEFRHECFQRDQPQLLSQITRGGTAAAANSDGPAAEIESLKIQVDKLSKAMHYALSELHARGFDTLAFDWKELMFMNPAGAAPGLAADVAPAPPLLPKADSATRAAASGSMMYLQNSVMDIRAEKGELDAESARASKYAKLEHADGSLPPPPPPVGTMALSAGGCPPPMGAANLSDLPHYGGVPLPQVASGIAPPMPPPAGSGTAPGVPMPSSSQALSTLAEAASLMHPPPHASSSAPAIPQPSLGSLDAALPASSVDVGPALGSDAADSRSDPVATVRQFLDSSTSLTCPKAQEDVKRLAMGGHHAEAARVAQEAMSAYSVPAVPAPDACADAGLVPPPT